MEFVVGLPHAKIWYDSIWVIVDRLMMSTHFHYMKKTNNAARSANLYLKSEIAWY